MQFRTARPSGLPRSPSKPTDPAGYSLPACVRSSRRTARSRRGRCSSSSTCRVRRSTSGPGQYFWVELPDRGYEDEKGLRRHISVVTSPTERGVLGLCTRLRDTAFKKTLAELEGRRRGRRRAAEGRLASARGHEPRRTSSSPGGIGITVFRSMLRYIADTGEPYRVTLVYSNRDRESTPFLDELQELEKTIPDFKLVLTMTQDEGWEGETPLRERGAAARPPRRRARRPHVPRGRAAGDGRGGHGRARAPRACPRSRCSRTASAATRRVEPRGGRALGNARCARHRPRDRPGRAAVRLRRRDEPALARGLERDRGGLHALGERGASDRGRDPRRRGAPRPARRWAPSSSGRTHRALGGHELHLGALRGADALKGVLIVGVMTLHSFAEGVGIGVSYGGGAELGIFITIAIAIHNIPEGLAISLVLVPRGASVRAAAGWSIFSSLPQPLVAGAGLPVRRAVPAIPGRRARLRRRRDDLARIRRAAPGCARGARDFGAWLSGSAAPCS